MPSAVRAEGRPHPTPHIRHPAATPRILFLDHAAVLGGAELSLLDVARAERANGGRVLLMEDGPFRDRLASEGVDVRVLGGGERMRAVKKSSSLPSPRAALGALSVARRVAAEAREFDLIYANSQKSFVVAAVAGRIARRPVLWHLRDILDRAHFSGANVRLVVALANRASARVVANSRATADAFVAAGGLANRVRVVHNGIEPAPFLGACNDGSLRAELKIPAAAPLLGVFGRLSPWKGQHVLLEALPQLPTSHAVFVGAPLFGEDAYAARLRADAESLGVADRVHFLGFRSDVPRLTRAVDVVVHTSTAPEPFGRVLVEGMLAGRPVIATAAGGALEIVRDGETGLLVPPGDADALADAVASLLANPGAMARMGGAGRERALAHFSLDATLRGVAEQVAEAVER
ncbi:MAG TPA: glycosyltransferase [Gemmatimonadaceae bacterium]|nr:glycosyltransferase [Gemmatimonadaceae bacterium]